MVHAWSSPSRQTCLWVDESHDAEPNRTGGVTASAGRWRLARAAWPGDSEQNRQIVHTLETCAPRDLVDESRGVYSVVATSSDGSIQAFADPLGFAQLFTCSTSKGEVVASHAGLAAWAQFILTRARPTADHHSLAWLTAGSPRYDHGTGYAGVAQVQPGTLVRVSATGAPTTEPVWTPPWRQPRDARQQQHQRPEEHASWFAEEVASSIDAARKLAGDAPVAVDLTGGRDSRAILAAILAAGLGEECEFHTVGPPHLPDVQVASLLAEKYGLNHRRRLPHRKRLSPIAEIEQTVRLTEAMTSAFRTMPLERTDQVVRVSGIFDGLRPKHSHDNATLKSARNKISNVALPNRLGLLDDDLVADLRRKLHETVLGAEPREEQEYLNDRLDAMWLTFDLRRHVGAMQPFIGLHRVLPLYSTRSIDIAYGNGERARREHEFHEGIFGLVPGLRDVPFSEELVPRSKKAIPSPERPTAPIRRDDVPTIGRLARANTADERQHTFRHYVDAAPAAAWDHIRKDNLEAALSEQPPPRAHQRELFGAVSTLAWLANVESADWSREPS